MVSHTLQDITRKCQVVSASKHNHAGKTPPKREVQIQMTSPSTGGTNTIVSSSEAGTASSSALHSKQPQARMNNLGNVRELRFYDNHTLFWEVCGPVTVESPADMNNSSMFSYLIIVCDANVVLLNIVNGHCRILLSDIPSVLSVEPLNRSIVVAGCADGTLRLHDWYNNSKVGSAPKIHSKEILQIIAARQSQNTGTQRETGALSSARFITVGGDNIAVLCECDITVNDETGMQKVKTSYRMKMENIFINDSVADIVAYDSQRNFMTAFHSGLQHVIVFDLSTALQPPKKSKVPILAAFLWLNIPNLSTSSVIIPANHPSYSDTALTFWSSVKAVSDISLLAAPVISKAAHVKPETHSALHLSDLQV